jgi:hypothetical protein
MLFSALLIASACLFSFAVVFGLSAEVQVRRIHASSIVAIVQNCFPNWNRSMIELPRNAMCSFNVFPVEKMPVPVLVQRAFPQPASIIDEHFGFKPFAERSAWRAGNLWHEAHETILVPSAQVPIRVVLAFGSEKQMRRPHATRIIALMANAESNGELSKTFLVDEAGGSQRLSILRENGSTSISQSTSPIPTVARTVNVFPESENCLHPFAHTCDYAQAA